MSEGLDLGQVIGEIHTDIRELRVHMDNTYIRKDTFDFHKSILYTIITAVATFFGIDKFH
jgi:hypothetical protein